MRRLFFAVLLLLPACGQTPPVSSPNAADAPDAEGAKKAIKSHAFDPSSVQFSSVEEAESKESIPPDFHKVHFLRVRGTWKVQSGRSDHFDWLCFVPEVAGGAPENWLAAPNPRGDAWRDPDKK